MSTGTLNEMEESFHILPMPLKPKCDCSFCDKTFTIKQSLKSHLGCGHGCEGKFACKTFQRTYTSNETSKLAYYNYVYSYGMMAGHYFKSE